ncbi:nucleotide exchange factor GrpE [Evansella sp. AB-P1]|uniref:nucleotide exchange factor GrpE n=1 Tax=Evansella sp. AB-P1 TaxID=3037653 RepID=UPI00241D9D8A|nr:nucleotide exchange factor GrpE [Evansella sp. AB-P1]MDG5786532.1 nucleotide exchange factor GrpE [Evansella sp. AB-P1]
MEKNNNTTTNEEINEEVIEENQEVVEETNTQTDEEASNVEDEISPQQELEQKLEETTNRLLRTQADYENLRRRTRLEKEADAKYRSQRLVEELLPAIDNFERALMIDAESDETKNLLQGVEMVYRQIKEALSKEGIETIETVGHSFDPHIHQAVMQVETDEYDKNVVVEELQKGYKLKDRVIRPAMVKVNS